MTAAAEVVRVTLVVAVLIWLIIAPTELKVDLTALGSARRHCNGVGITFFINRAATLFSMATLGTPFLGWLFRPPRSAPEISRIDRQHDRG